MILPRLIGHRGAAGVAPENTLASFRRAAALGARMVEFDVRLSRDGVGVVFHDDVLERTTDGQGAVKDHAWLDLERLDAGSWFGAAFAGEPVPSLEQTLAVCAGLGLAVNMEIKPDFGREAETARVALETAGACWPLGLEPPLVSSFSEIAMEVALDLAPHWPRGLLVEEVPADVTVRTARLGCRAVHANHKALAAESVAALGRSGLLVLAYTVNGTDRQKELWQAGVSAVFTDFPGSS